MQSTKYLSEKLNDTKMQRINFNHEFTEKFIVLEDKRFNNKIKIIEPSLDKKPSSSSKFLQKPNKINKVNNLKINNQTKQTLLPSSHNIKQINSSTHLFANNKANNTKIEINNKIKSNSSSIYSNNSSSNKNKTDKKNVTPSNSPKYKPLITNKQDENVVKKRAINQTAALNTKAKLLNRVKQKTQKKSSQTDNNNSKVSANLLNELMSSLITYIKENKETINKSNPKSRKSSKTINYSETEISINTEPINTNHIVEEYLKNTFTDPMDVRRQKNCSASLPSSSSSLSSSSSYSSLSQATTVSSNSSSSYFKMFSRPNYYKKLNENKNNIKPLPASSTCSSLYSATTNSAANNTTTNIQSSLYLSCDDFTESTTTNTTNNSNNKNNLALSNKSAVSITSSSHNHRQLEIPNIDDPILFIDTLYNQLLANNNNIIGISESNSTEKICLYDTDYTCRSSSRLTSPRDLNNNNNNNKNSSIVSRSNSSIEVSEIHCMNDSNSIFKSNLLLTNCSLLNDDFTVNSRRIENRRRPRQRSASNLVTAITVDCTNNTSNLTRNYLMTPSSQSSPSLSFLTSSSSASMNSSSCFSATNRVKHKFRNRQNLYLSASWANLCSSSSFSPSMSTSISSSNHQYQQQNSTNDNSTSDSMHYMYNIQRNLQQLTTTTEENTTNNDYYSNNNNRLIKAKSSISSKLTNAASDTTNNDESTSYMQIIFDSFLKSIKFLIMTKNVLILPLIIYLLNNKFKQFIRTTTNQSSSLLSTAASSIVTSASQSAKMKFT